MNEIKSNINLNNDNLFKGKLEKMRNLSKDVNKRIQLSPEEKAGYAEAARGFEAMFINMMMKEMKSGMLKDDKQSGMSFGSDTLMGYTDMLFSEEMANSGGGIGIAKMIYEQLTGDKLRFKTNSVSNEGLLGSARNEGGRSLRGIEVSEHSSPPDKGDLGGLRNSYVHLPSEEIPQTPFIKGALRGGDLMNQISTFDEGKGNFLDNVSSRLSKHSSVISDSAKQNGIPESLIKAVITAESAGKENASSHAGAKGLMQLMDATAEELGVKNSFDPVQNIDGGSRYLKMMLDRYSGDLDKALAAYNAGPGNVDKYGGVPPFDETQQYIRKIKKYLNDFDRIMQGKEL